MPKLIAGRYIVENEKETLATDSKSPDKEVVQIKCWKRQKLDDLIHNIFLRRAKEFSNIRTSAVVPIIDFGFDGQNSCYFVVYSLIGGTTQLSYLIKQGALPIQNVIPVLLGVTESLTALHLNNFYGGIINPPNILLAGDLKQPTVMLNMAGIEGFELLLGLNKSAERTSQQKFIVEDIAQLAYLAITMLTRQRDPSYESIEEMGKLQSLPASFCEFLKRAVLDNETPYISISELKRDLNKAIGEIQSESNYYLVPTKNVAQKLASWGFIQKDEVYIATDFLNQEFIGEKFARIYETPQIEDLGGNGNVRYSLTTQRFRMLCAPSQDAPTKSLAIIGIDCPSPTSLVAEREIGLNITSTIKAAMQINIPPTANILPLLDQLKNHQLLSYQIKQKELEEKNGLEVWQKVLNLQKRLLDQFQVPFTNWALTDDGNTMLVDLKEELESLDVSEDERLVMSSVDGRRSLPVGYYQELDSNRLKISLLSNINTDEVAKFGIITRDNFQVKSILTRQEDALRRLRFRESTNPDLLNLLMDPTELKYEKIVNPVFWDNGLDDNQKETIKNALGIKDMFLVHGPPGTGKTRTIVELVRQIINSSDGKEQKILITSQSNVAVNHALGSLLEQQPGLRETVVRVGRQEKAGETGDLLLDYQIIKWSDLVKTRSNQFIDIQRKKLDVKPQLAECFSMIDECERLQKELNLVRSQVEERSKEYNAANDELEVLNVLMAKTESLRREASGLLAKIGSRDIKFINILDTFDKNYLEWATEFLSQANELSKLSARRIDVQDQLGDLKNLEIKFKSDFDAGNNLVRESLLEMFNKDMPDLDTQRKFINEKLASQQDSALKLGRIQKINQDWCQRINRGVTEFEGAYLSHCNVIGATCIGVASKGDVSDIEFDWVIVDEAGRSTYPELVVPLVRGRKIVLVGDHHQLPPIVDKELTDDLLEEIEVLRKNLETSLFKDMIQPESGKTPRTQSRLKMQYRMSREIGNLVSKCFYDGGLLHASSVENINHRQKWIKTPVVWFSTSKIKRHEENKLGYSFQNMAESEVTKNILDRLEADLASQNITRSVGIIAGYMGQKKLLRQQIGRDLSLWPHMNIEINTVDAYQGQEKDYIIYSVVRSNAQRKIGFLQDERRLNVALSRARELLIIVGDPETAEFANTGGRDNPFFRVMKHIRENVADCSFKEYEL